MLVKNWWEWDVAVTPKPESTEPAPAEEKNFLLRVYMAGLGEIREMELEEYLAGAVAAEMPASFDPEALKAQAVVSRTYTLHKVLGLGGEGCRNHPGADLCTDAACCQAWEDNRQALEKCRPKMPSLSGKIRGGQLNRRACINIRGNLIQAVYHSTCGE